MKKAIEFLEKIKSANIYFHNDTDGCSTAALMHALFKQKGIKSKLFSGDIDEEDFRNFAEEKNEYYIFLDFAIDQYPEFLKPFKKEKVIIIDHHPVSNNLNKLGFVHINPRIEKPDLYVSASQVCFEICKKLGLKNFEWLMRLGAVGDRALKGNKEEIEAAEMVDAIKVMKKEKGLIKLAKFLSTCKDLDDLLYKEEYLKLREKYEKELKEQIKRFEIYMNEITFFEVKAKYGLTSSLSSRLLDKYPNKTIITYSKSDGFYKFSGRSKKFDVGGIFKKASEGLGRGGGHPKAGAAKIPLVHFGKFRKRVLEMMK